MSCGRFAKNIVNLRRWKTGDRGNSCARGAAIYRGLGAKAKAMSMADGAKKYFKDTFFVELRSDVAFYRTCRYMNPAWAKTTDGNIIERVPQALRGDVQGLAWFEADEVAGMLREYP